LDCSAITLKAPSFQKKLPFTTSGKLLGRYTLVSPLLT